MPSAIPPAIQLYTVRELLDADVFGTLATLTDIGFREVEAFDLPRYGTRLATALPTTGLKAVSVHADLLEDAGAALEAADELGIPLVIHPWTDPARWTNAADVAAIATKLNAAARRADALGIRVGYHNHHFELASRIGGRHALEVFADQLDAGVVLEVDLYWAFAGGADVPALLRRLGGRVVALHVKDGDGSLDTSRQVAVGQGVVPIRECREAAPDARAIVELDDTAGDLLAAIQDSLSFLLGPARG